MKMQGLKPIKELFDITKPIVTSKPYAQIIILIKCSHVINFCWFIKIVNIF